MAALAAVTVASAQGKITVVHTAVADYAPGFIAVDDGLFKKRGLDVEFKLVPLNPQIPAALQSESAQVGGTTTPVQIQAVDGGLDLVAIAASGVTRKGLDLAAVVARAEAPIATAKAFEGKKVGAPGLGAFLHVLFRHWLLDNGADYKKITFVEVGFPQHLDVLKGGTVDAVISGEPTVSRMVAAGVGKVSTYFTDNLKGELPIITYVVTRKWLTANPKAAQAFQEAIAEATAIANKDHERVRAAVGKYIKLPPEVLASLRFGVWNAAVTPAGHAELARHHGAPGHAADQDRRRQAIMK